MVSVSRFCALLITVFLLGGCGNMMNDLYPSGDNKVPPAMPGTIGPAVGQNAPDFTLSDTLGNSVTLSSVVTSTGVRGVVLYFTMWCPVCDTHMSAMRSGFIPQNPDVRFFAVDYVSGSVSAARASEIANGYDGSGFTVLADTQQTVLANYQATMGSTVVVDKSGVIRMNEDFKDGTRLQAALAALP
jgi:peroxiredoxin